MVGRLCRALQPPEGTPAIGRASGARAWRRAPGFPERKPSFTAHSSEVEIFVNEPVATALDGPSPVIEWPVGSIVVKEGFRGGDRQIVAMMEKRDDGWFWAETDGEGAPLYSGKPDVCVDCHDNRASYSDWVYSFELPR